MQNLIENKKGFSSKGHITKQELAKCFMSALTALTAAAGGSLAIFQDAVLKQSWLFLALWGIIFIGMFGYKVIEKLARDGSQINYNIHKELLGQNTGEDQM